MCTLEDFCEIVYIQHHNFLFCFYTSDGMLRVFTMVPNRVASEEECRTLQEEVASFKISGSKGDLGEIKVEDLPDETSLLRPGTPLFTSGYESYEYFQDGLNV